MNYYEVLGVSPQRDRRRDQEGVPRARPPVPPRREPRRPAARSSASRRSTRRTRRCAIPSAAAATTCSGPTARRGAVGGGSPFDAGAFGLNDLFDAFFGGDAFGGGRGPAGPARGPDAETVLDLTLDDVVFGARQTLDLQHADRVRDAATASGCAPGHASRPLPDVRRQRRGAPGPPLAARPDRDRRPVPDVLRRPARSIPNPCDDVPAATGRVDGHALDRGRRARAASTTASGCGSSGRGPAAPRGGTGRRPLRRRARRAAPRARAARRRALAPAAGLDRAGRARHAARDRRRSTVPREIDVAAGTQPGALIRLRGLGVPSLRTARRGDLVVEVARRRADAT